MPDDPVICAICAQPIEEGEARYRGPRGDVHVACYEQHPPLPEPKEGGAA